MVALQPAAELVKDACPAPTCGTARACSDSCQTSGRPAPRQGWWPPRARLQETLSATEVRLAVRAVPRQVHEPADRRWCRGTQLSPALNGHLVSWVVTAQGVRSHVAAERDAKRPRAHQVRGALQLHVTLVHLLVVLQTEQLRAGLKVQQVGGQGARQRRDQGSD